MINNNNNLHTDVNRLLPIPILVHFSHLSTRFTYLHKYLQQMYLYKFLSKKQKKKKIE